MKRLLPFAFALLALAFALPAAAAAKQPPACAALSFHPLTGHLSEGDNPAGHYSSRFGVIDVVGTVKNGQPTDYRVQVNRQPLKPLAGEIPKSSYGCLNSKHIKTPPEPLGGACMGNRYRVAIDSTGKEKLIMLFTLQGDDWKLCQAGTPAPK